MLKKLSILLLMAVVVIACNESSKKESAITEDNSEANITTYYLIRHAEKDRSDPENPDPKLTALGEARAANWAKYFDTIALDAVYSTKYLRTVMTASPTAVSKQLDVLSYEPTKLFSDDFKNATKHQKVLIVGHSNTTPAFVNKIVGLKKYPDMSDDDNSTLFIVKIYKIAHEIEVRTVSL